MNSTRKNTMLSLCLLVLYTATYLFSLTWERPIAFYYYAMSAGTALCFALFLRGLPSFYYLAFTLFTVMAQYFGSMLGAYHAISFYDLLLHFTSGLLLVLVGHLVYERLLCSRPEKERLPIALPVLFSLLFSIAAAGLWEIYEFCGDYFFNLQAQGGSLSDTMTDIIAGTLGALLGACVLARKLHRRSSSGHC